MANQGLINYDKRRHEHVYETNIEAALGKIQELIIGIDGITESDEVVLEVSYDKTNEDAIKINSSVGRELAYNIEHAIHHMAIIKIAVQTLFPNVKLAENFGVAYSTVRYKKTEVK